MQEPGQSSRGPRDERGALYDKIVKIARTSFAERGFAATSMRSVARGAEVDPSLVRYYFPGGKEALLDAVLTLPESFSVALSAAVHTPLAERGTALLELFIAAWEDPTNVEILTLLLLTASHEPQVMQRLRAFHEALILPAIAASLPDEERLLRAGLTSSHILGLAMTRYVWKINPVATLPADRLTAIVAPNIQRYLSGSLDPASP
ncbi:TetR/AcrR family transcriptional regulator [Streptomyces sp. 061-3]|uniref:TetR/AcrR family transcriptional regulator n=1 Tax=Streptomyces sp. 061-3 TaxID=2789268 RepID=UPI00397FC39D